MSGELSEKRRPGRPRKPDGQARRAHFQTRMREPLRQKLRDAADQNGRSLSEEIEWRLEMSFSAVGGCCWRSSE